MSERMETIAWAQLVSNAIAVAGKRTTFAARHGLKFVTDLVEEARRARASEATLRAQLLEVHDALHASCDGAVDLPTEIRALRAQVEEMRRALDVIHAAVAGKDWNRAREWLDARDIYHGDLSGGGPDPLLEAVACAALSTPKEPQAAPRIVVTPSAFQMLPEDSRTVCGVRFGPKRTPCQLPPGHWRTP